MITVNAITISSPTRFQVSFDLAPPYTKDETKVAGDGKWSAQCGVVANMSPDPVPVYATIFTEGAHNIAPHDGEPVPCISAIYAYDVVNFSLPPWNPDYPPGSFAIACDPIAHGTGGHFDKMWMVYTVKPGVPKAWRVEVNNIHGAEHEVRDAHRRRRGGCLIPWWWWPLPLGRDHASELFAQIGLASPAGDAAPAKKAKTATKPKKRRK